MIAIIKYNAGNTKSVQNALTKLGVDSIVTDDIELIQKAEKVILPGVGEASSAMIYLKEKGLDVVIQNLTQPVLGICLGLQLMCQFTEEGNTEGLQIFDNEVKRFDDQLIVPHMGWNSLTNVKGELAIGLENNTDVYFVHSYYVQAKTPNLIAATTDYGVSINAALGRDNIFAAQFHPEKSSTAGLQLLNNFLQWDGQA